MALVNDNNKFMFFHLYKCGGTSMRKYIFDNTEDTYEMQSGHSSPIDMKLQFDYDGNPNKLDDYYKFTFIRNPFDWIVSVLFYAKTYSGHFMHNDVVHMNMEQFIPYYMDFRNKNIQQKREMFGNNRVVTIKDWLLNDNDKLLVDFVGKTETIEKDMKIISEVLDIDYNEMPYINVNTNRGIDYRQYYNDASRKMIEDYFGWELDYFKYTF